MGSENWRRLEEKVLAYYQQQNQSQPADLSKNEATLETCGPKPIALHPDKETGSKNRGIDLQAIYDEGAGEQMERAQHGGQRTHQPEVEKSESNQKMEESNTETGATETAKKGLEEKGDAMELSAFLRLDTMENPCGEGFIEQISPVDRDWEIVDHPIVPGAPPSDRSSSWVGVGDPQPRSLLSHIKGVVRVIAYTGRPDPIVQAHGAQYPSSLKHVAPGGTPKGTDSEASQEMGAYTAHDSPVDVEEYQIIQKAGEEQPDSGVNHPQQVDSDSPNLRRVGADKIAGRPENAGELRFSSLHSLGNTPLAQPRYVDKSIAKTDSPLARTQLLLPGEWSRSGE